RQRCLGKPDPHFLPGGVCGADTIEARSWRNVLMMLVMDRLMILGQVFGFRDVFSLFLSTLMPLCSGFSSRLPACP
ncbi:hypothetical protein, partial [Pseudomonas syringae]